MKTIILCGGMGTRLREETEYKPKPMVEIGGKPILWHIMKHYSSYGYNDFILALGYKGDVIRNYFLNYYNYNRDFTVDLSNGSLAIENKDSDNNWKVTLVETGQESMTGFRAKIAGQFINEERFMLTYGDAVSTVNLKKLVEFNEKENTIGTVTGVYPPSRFGDLIVEKKYVKQFKQQIKDSKNQQPINWGYFVFKKEFLDFIPNDIHSILEEDPINKITEQSELSVFRHKGFWHCMDTFRDNLYLNDLWKQKPVWKTWI